jgi:SMC interacting uncharacterized protein involved in chromosome segregation
MDARDSEIEKLYRMLQEKESLLEQQAASLQQLTGQLESANEKLAEIEAQHVATTEQFSLSIEEKNQEIRLLQAKIKQLLRTVRGSRQERITERSLRVCVVRRPSERNSNVFYDLQTNKSGQA